jgi:hypothetical protein
MELQEMEVAMKNLRIQIDESVKLQKYELASDTKMEVKKILNKYNPLK